MDISTRYSTILKKDKSYYLVLNNGHKHKGYTELFILKKMKNSFVIQNSKKIIEK